MSLESEGCTTTEFWMMFKFKHFFLMREAVATRTVTNGLSRLLLYEACWTEHR